MAIVTRRSFLKGASVAISTAPLLGAKEGVAGSDAGAPALDVDAKTELTLRTNGQDKRVKVTPDTTLAQALRVELGMTGTKVSCEGGACGACTVLVDGKTTNACLTLAIDAEGRDVSTIEGVATDGVLHPVQQAFVDADALQCGYCTPGMVMSAVAFYDRWRREHSGRPSRDEVNQAMAGNLCRCGAQPAIIGAVQAACAGQTAKPPGPAAPVYALKRFDAKEKVTGAAKYAFDVFPEGGLFAAFVRSPHGHAKVSAVDVSKAKSMPGVEGVVVLAEKLGGGFLTMRWVGQEIAAIAAKTEPQAIAAARAITVTYDVLPVVASPAAAAKEGATQVWSDPDNQDVPNAAEGPGAPGFLTPWNGNIRGPAAWPFSGANSSATEAIDDADVRVEREFSTEVQVHASLERHVCVAIPDEDGGLLVHASTQTVQILANEIAEALEIPAQKVRVLSPYVGGGFGAKAGLRAEHLAAAKLAMQTKKPVRLATTFEDHLTIGGNRPGTEHEIKIGANQKGKLIAVAHKGRSNCGAAIGERSTGMTADHYTFDEAEAIDDNVVTNGAPACPWRAPGFPANAFALEQAIDDVAVATGQDPLLLRVANDERRRFRGVYRLARDRSGLVSRMQDVGKDAKNSQTRILRGVGVATAHWFVLTSPSCQVRLRARRDGTLEVATATQDMGQGSRTVLANVVTEALGISPDKLTVLVGASDLPPAPGSFGSITTGSIAPAAFHAALALQDELVEGALKADRGVRRTERGVVTKRGELVPWKDLFADLGEDLVEVSAKRGADKEGFALPPRIFDAFAEQIPFAVAKDEVSSAQVADVEVDRLTGAVRVKRVVVALDAGRIASPVTARSQVIGAVMQGVSYALYEARRLDAKTGRNLSASFDSYPILGISDAPEVEVHFFDAPSENNPYGSLGLGENAIIATAAAVANGIYRATGQRLTSTPMRPDAVLKALEA